MENPTDNTEIIEEQGMSRGSKLGMAFAFIVLIAAYFFACLVPVSRSPLGFLVLSAAFYIVTLVICLVSGGRINRGAILALIFGMAFALHEFIHGMSLRSALFNIYPVFLLSMLAYGYFVISLFNNNCGELSGRFLLDLWKAIAYLFISFGAFFTDIFKPKGAKKHGKTILMVMAGIVAAFILAVIVGSLLSYDEHFYSMMPKLDIESIGEFIKRCIIAVPVAAMIYSVYASSREKKMSAFSSEEAAERSARKMKAIPYLIVLLPVAALLIMYVMFFISQRAYYVSAFTHKLPEGYSAAEYAREGFFQLFWVAGINGLLIVILGCFTKNEGKTSEGLIKAAKILLAGATLVLIITAISKMLLYIDMYDLTQDRLYATLILVFMGLSFIYVLLAAIIPKMKALPFILATGLVMALFFSFVNTDGFIAKYNVDSYLSGNHENIDLNYLERGLGSSGITELQRLIDNCDDASVINKAKDVLRRAAQVDIWTEREWYEYDIPYIRSLGILDKYRGKIGGTN